MDLVIVLLVVNAIVGAVFCAYLAREKGRDAFSWGALGLLFGLIALLVLGFAPSIERDASSASNRSAPFELDSETKKCPACAEYIKLEALRCRYCGNEFDQNETQAEIDRRRTASVSATEPTISDDDKKAIAIGIFILIIVGVPLLIATCH